jgi:hypothetical protein
MTSSNQLKKLSQVSLRGEYPQNKNKSQRQLTSTLNNQINNFIGK